MFCHKCGTQLVEGAAFCQRCGVKIVYEDAPPQLTKQGTVSTASVAAIPMHSPNTVTSTDNFKEFVDHHIQATTQFQSVEDLINNSKPMKFAWTCLGILSLIGLILGAINLGGAGGALAGLLLFGGFSVMLSRLSQVELSGSSTEISSMESLNRRSALRISLCS